jgi:hypothetical protein
MTEVTHKIAVIDEGSDPERTEQLGCCLVSFGYLF